MRRECSSDIHSFIQRLFIEHMLFAKVSGAHRDEQNWIVPPWNRQPEWQNCNLGLNQQKSELPLRFSHSFSARFAHGKCYSFFALGSIVKAWQSPFPKDEVPCMVSGVVSSGQRRGHRSLQTWGPLLSMLTLLTWAPQCRPSFSSSDGSFTPSILRNLHTVLHSGCISLHSHQQPSHPTDGYVPPMKPELKKTQGPQRSL